MIRITFEVTERQYLDPDAMAATVKKVCTDLDYYTNGFGSDFNLGKGLTMKVEETDDGLEGNN